MTYPPPQQPGNPYQQQPYPAAPPYGQQPGYHQEPGYYGQQSGPQFLPPEAGPQYARFDPASPVRVLANPGRRLVARLIDYLVIIVLFGGIGAAIAGLTDGFSDRKVGDVGSTLAIIGFVIVILGWVLYEPLFNSLKGGTPGKLAMGIRVVRVATARYPGFGAALGRFLIVPVLGIIPFGGLLNVLWCLWDRPLYQCLHDKVAGTVVVYKEGQEPPQYGNV